MKDIDGEERCYLEEKHRDSSSSTGKQPHSSQNDQLVRRSLLLSIINSSVTIRDTIHDVAQA